MERDKIIMSYKTEFFSPKLLALTTIVEALERFQAFEPTVRAAAIALYASELDIARLHLYAIAHHAGLLGGV